MRDKPIDPAKVHPPEAGRPVAKPAKDAKLAAALRANLARRKAAARQARVGLAPSSNPNTEES